MSDLYDSIISDPCLAFKGKAAVMYRGHKMLPSTAQRLKELRPYVIQMAQQGIPMRQGAIKLGYSKQALVNYLKIFGVRWKAAKVGGPKQKVDKTGWWDLIHKAAAEGDTLETLGDRIGVHPMNLHRYCKRHNIAWKQIRTYGKQTHRNR